MVTHALVLAIQGVAFLPYTAAFVRIAGRRVNALTHVLVVCGLALDALLGVTASLFSDLGGNRQGAPWDNPLFVSHVVLAGVGMFGFLGLLLLLVLRRQPWSERFAARAVWVVFPCWAAGVVIAMANVLFRFY